jgi:hypothetical protein
MPEGLSPLLGSDAPSPLHPTPAIRPGAYATPMQFGELSAEELALLSHLAAQVLEDPLAIQQLSDRVVELLGQDLEIERERDRGYGRRW